MKTIEDLLAEHTFFSDLDPRDRTIIAGCGSNFHIEANRYIFRAEERADRFFAVREGKIALEAFAPQRGPLVIETIGPGEVLGWSWLFPPYRWQFDARAVEPVRAIAFDGACLRSKCEQDHDLGWRLALRFSRIMMQRLQATRLRLLDIYGNP